MFLILITLEDNRSMDMLNFQISLENEDNALKLESNYYIIGEGYNMATQSKDFADNSTFESDVLDLAQQVQLMIY